MTEYDDNPKVSYISYKNDDDDYYHVDFFNDDGTIKKKRSFPTEKALEDYVRYLYLKDKYKDNTISEKEFKEYELCLRRHFINKHYEQFIKLKPYGRFKIILKLYNAKYHFNISDDTFKHYLRDNFNI